MHIGWYSVTPQQIAKYIATQFCKNLRIMDGFMGAGGNTIQFAKLLQPNNSKNYYVLGCDIDSKKTRMAKKNCEIYKIPKQNVKILNTCYFKMTEYQLAMKGYENGKVDVLFLSPPWGGVDYNSKKGYKLSKMRPDFNKIIYHASMICRSMILFLPKNIDLMELLESISYNTFQQRDNQWWVRWERIYRGSKLKMYVFYVGRFLVDFSESELNAFQSKVED